MNSTAVALGSKKADKVGAHRFSVAPMMECSVCRRIFSFFNSLGGSPSVGVVLFVVQLR